jgi:hypothetical protein
MCDVVLDATLLCAKGETLFLHITSERERKRLLSFSKSGERRKDGERRYMYTYISNIYRFVGVTGIIIIIIIYRSSRSSTGSIKTVRSAICVYVYSIAFVLAWCVYIISS